MKLYATCLLSLLLLAPVGLAAATASSATPVPAVDANMSPASPAGDADLVELRTALFTPSADCDAAAREALPNSDNGKFEATGTHCGWCSDDNCRGLNVGDLCDLNSNQKPRFGLCTSYYHSPICSPPSTVNRCYCDSGL